MQSHARFLGHPVHQMLVVFPLGLLGVAVLFDLLAHAFEVAELAVASFWMTAAGIVAAIAAAPFGLIDWWHVPRGTRARRVGALHGVGNGLVTLLFALSWLLREDNRSAGIPALLLSCAGLALALVTAWLGG